MALQGSYKRPAPILIPPPLRFSARIGQVRATLADLCTQFPHVAGDRAGATAGSGSGPMREDYGQYSTDDGENPRDGRQSPYVQPASFSVLLALALPF